MSIDQEKLGNTTLYEPLQGFPISTVAQFQELDSPTNKQSRRKVHDHLLRLGGSKLREFLSCGLKEIMTDELVCQFTWHESSQTQQLGDTKVSNILYQAAVNCHLFQGPENKSIFKAEMLQVLRATKQRFRNSRKKSLSRRTERMEEEEEEETEESIQRKISQLQEMVPESDADDEDEEFDADNLEGDED